MITSVLKKYIWVINLILIAGIAYTLALIVNDKIKAGIFTTQTETGIFSNPKDFVDGRRKQVASRTSYDVILKRNIFGLQTTSSSTSLMQDAPQTTLNLELLGTFIEPGEKSVAIIRNVDTNKARGYVEGEVIDIIQSESVRLAKVEKCRALVERGEGPETIKCRKDVEDISSGSTASPGERLKGLQAGKILSKNILERVNNDDDEGIKEVNEGIYEVDQTMLDELLTNPNELLTQARVIPQEDGLRFFAIRPNSIFFKIGIRNGDTLHKINEVELSNVENALNLFEELRGRSKFNINFTRRGQKLTYEYTVK
jgi:general secretion pathway protein C